VNTTMRKSAIVDSSNSYEHTSKLAPHSEYGARCTSWIGLERRSLNIIAARARQRQPTEDRATPRERVDP
jgi:hypothetical protein